MTTGVADLVETEIRIEDETGMIMTVATGTSQMEMDMVRQINT